MKYRVVMDRTVRTATIHDANCGNGCCKGSNTKTLPSMRDVNLFIISKEQELKIRFAILLCHKGCC